jgi:signal transduction histidine kinase/ActR/RegA family two-component response regulator
MKPGQNSDERDEAGEERDRLADERDSVADRRDQAAERRDRAAARRDHAADQRDGTAAERDRVAARADALLDHQSTTDAPAVARRAAASDRRRASEDRRAGASERADAGLDRDTAQSERGAGAVERADAESDRDIAQADRWVSATERGESELDAEALASARDAALESSKFKSGFIATLTHEFRTPMNGVMGLTSLLLDTDLDDQQRGYAEGVQGSGKTLLAIVDDILDFSTIEANELELKMTNFTLARVLDEAAGLVAEAASSKGLQLAFLCDESVPTRFRGDPDRVRQVVVILASNAVKFTDRGRVVVRVRPATDATDRALIRVEVTDTGIGIAEADRQIIFEPFRQADASTTRRFGGTGLGLAIASHLVASMGGQIGVESELGRGSTFWCTLALEETSNEQDPPVRRTSVAAETSGHADAPAGRVLVVDDNAVNQLVAVAMLRKLGYRADVAANGLEALDALGRTAYAAVLLDCNMPVMDGYQATAAIRRRPGADAATPVVAMTANTRDGDRERCLAAGMDGYIAKPITISAVRTALSSVLVH